MIVPTNRLLIFYAVTIPFLTLLPVLKGGAAMLAMGGCIMVILIGLLDAVFAPASSRRISIRLPETVRMAKDRKSFLEVSLTNDHTQPRTLRLGLPFPSEISTPQQDLSAVLPPGSQPLGFLWPCTALRRGQFDINKCHLETKSPLGLWAFRDTKKVTCQMRVYPSLIEERNSLAALFLNRGGYGVHTRRQHGKGREFEKLREYIPGDGFDEIHWKATAKRRRPITKIFQIERTQEVYVIIDASRLSARPALAKDDSHAGARTILNVTDSSLERFIAAALVLGLAAQKQGDLFGILTFSDSIHAFLRARGGKPHYSACREQLLSLHPRMVNPDYGELSTFIGLKLRRRALIVLLTSLDDPVLAESFGHSMDLVGRHHLVMVNMLKPAGVQPIFSNPNIASSEEIYNELSGHILWHHLREMERTLSLRGIHFALLDHARLCVDLVSQYMNVKQRQLL